MNKKPGLLFAVSVFTIIIVAVSFNFNLGGNEPLKLPANVNPDTVLYVCKIGESSWNQAAESLRLLTSFAPAFFSFAGIVLVFSWGWAIYQNLLKDKFVDDAYKRPWLLTKVFFWLVVCFTVLVETPNHFRQVEIRGRGSDWVLCENTSDGVKATNYKNVSLP